MPNITIGEDTFKRIKEFAPCHSWTEYFLTSLALGATSITPSSSSKPYSETFSLGRFRGRRPHQEAGHQPSETYDRQNLGQEKNQTDQNSRPDDVSRDRSARMNGKEV